MRYKAILIAEEVDTLDKFGTLKRAPVLQEFSNNKAILQKWARGIMEHRKDGEVRIYEVKDELVDIVKPSWSAETSVKKV